MNEVAHEAILKGELDGVEGIRSIGVREDGVEVEFMDASRQVFGFTGQTSLSAGSQNDLSLVIYRLQGAGKLDVFFYRVEARERAAARLAEALSGWGGGAAPTGERRLVGRLGGAPYDPQGLAKEEAPRPKQGPFKNLVDVFREKIMGAPKAETPTRDPPVREKELSHPPMAVLLPPAPPSAKAAIQSASKARGVSQTHSQPNSQIHNQLSSQTHIPTHALPQTHSHQHSNAESNAHVRGIDDNTRSQLYSRFQAELATLQTQLGAQLAHARREAEEERALHSQAVINHTEIERSLRSEIERLRAETQRLRTALEAQASGLESLEAYRSEARLNAETKSLLIAQLKTESAKLEADRQRLRAQIDSLLLDKEALAAEKSTVQAENSALARRLEAASSEAASLSRGLRETRESSEGLSLEFLAQKARAERAEAALKALTLELESTRAALQEERSLAERIQKSSALAMPDREQWTASAYEENEMLRADAFLVREEKARLAEENRRLVEELDRTRGRAPETRR